MPYPKNHYRAPHKAVGFLCWWGMVVGPPNAKVADPHKPRLRPIRPLSFEVRISQSDFALRRSGHESTIRASRAVKPTAIASVFLLVGDGGLRSPMQGSRISASLGCAPFDPCPSRSEEVVTNPPSAQSAVYPPTNSSLSLLITQNMPKSTCMSALIYDCAIFVAVHALTNALQYVKINQ